MPKMHVSLKCIARLPGSAASAYRCMRHPGSWLQAEHVKGACQCRITGLHTSWADAETPCCAGAQVDSLTADAQSARLRSGSEALAARARAQEEELAQARNVLPMPVNLMRLSSGALIRT